MVDSLGGQQEFQVTISYRPGSRNGNTDGLSRQAWEGVSRPDVNEDVHPPECRRERCRGPARQAAIAALNIVYACSWASEVSPTLGCSIEISRDIIFIVFCVGGSKDFAVLYWPYSTAW